MQLDFQGRLIAARQSGRMSDAAGQDAISKLLRERLDSIIEGYNNRSRLVDEETEAAWHDWVKAAVKVALQSRPRIMDYTYRCFLDAVLAVETEYRGFDN